MPIRCRRPGLLLIAECGHVPQVAPHGFGPRSGESGALRCRRPVAGGGEVAATSHCIHTDIAVLWSPPAGTCMDSLLASVHVSAMTSGCTLLAALDNAHLRWSRAMARVGFVPLSAVPCSKGAHMSSSTSRAGGNRRCCACKSVVPDPACGGSGRNLCRRQLRVHQCGEHQLSLERQYLHHVQAQLRLQPPHKAFRFQNSRLAQA